MFPWWNSIDDVSKFYTVTQYLLVIFAVLTGLTMYLAIKAHSRINFLQKDEKSILETKLGKTLKDNEEIKKELEQAQTRISNIVEETKDTKNQAEQAQREAQKIIEQYGVIPIFLTSFFI